MDLSTFKEYLKRKDVYYGYNPNTGRVEFFVRDGLTFTSIINGWQTDSNHTEFTQVVRSTAPITQHYFKSVYFILKGLGLYDDSFAFEHKNKISRDFIDVVGSRKSSGRLIHANLILDSVAELRYNHIDVVINYPAMDILSKKHGVRSFVHQSSNDFGIRYDIIAFWDRSFMIFDFSEYRSGDVHLKDVSNFPKVFREFDYNLIKGKKFSEVPNIVREWTHDKIKELVDNHVGREYIGVYDDEATEEPLPAQ